MNDGINIQAIERFSEYLIEEERSPATISKYLHDMNVFYQFIGTDRILTKAKVVAFKSSLCEHYKTSSANSMLAAVNKFLEWYGRKDCQVRSLKTQKQIFSDTSRELNQNEYNRLITAARTSGKERLEMIMQTIGGTGIRIGELPYITVEAVQQGEVRVLGKGKHRVVFITAKLRSHLLRYCRQNNIRSGSVFITSGRKPVDRSNIWSEMKRICTLAGVDPHKVFPHNLRHLFARVCYQKKKDIVYLADILGHSSIETTRIYTVSSGREHKKMLASLGLVI